ncbi:hypothetical protein HDU93_000858 [Gonapodya sp. JEL0774]|nr:hypothetical protein HDU93_000858 [Gonapodya sp. JEL0774]
METKTTIVVPTSTSPDPSATSVDPGVDVILPSPIEDIFSSIVYPATILFPWPVPVPYPTPDPLPDPQPDTSWDSTPTFARTDYPGYYSPPEAPLSTSANSAFKYATLPATYGAETGTIPLNKLVQYGPKTTDKFEGSTPLYLAQSKCIFFRVKDPSVAMNCATLTTKTPIHIDHLVQVPTITDPVHSVPLTVIGARTIWGVAPTPHSPTDDLSTFLTSSISPAVWIAVGLSVLAAAMVAFTIAIMVWARKRAGLVPDSTRGARARSRGGGEYGARMSGQDYWNGWGDEKVKTMATEKHLGTLDSPVLPTAAGLASPRGDAAQMGRPAETLDSATTRGPTALVRAWLRGVAPTPAPVDPASLTIPASPSSVTH